jgi:LacI family transcriptional regulator
LKTSIVASGIEGWKEFGFGEFVLGMRKAFTDYGMPWTPDSIIDLHSNDAPKEGAVLEYLKSRNITGIFCPNWNDVMRLYCEARISNIKIGQDISVIGYGNQTHLDMFHPSVTRIIWEPCEVIDKAFEILISESMQKIIKKVSVRIVVGESTAQLKNG